MAVPSIHALMGHVLTIKQAVEERFTLPNADKIAIEQSETLYQIGLQIIAQEVRGAPTGETPLPVPLHHHECK